MKTYRMVALLCGTALMTLAIPASAGCNERCHPQPNPANPTCDVCKVEGFETGMSCMASSYCYCNETMCATPSFMQPIALQNNTPAEIVAKNCSAPMSVSRE